MTLAEKITALRGAHKLSQGDLAERMDVSRQLVSKWETGQSVPELDKIVKLADLFGVTVDELVRDGEAPSPEAIPAAEPEQKIVYIGLKRTPVQILGAILIAGGLVMMLFALAADAFLFMGAFIAIAGLPLLLAKKHPFLAEGWVVWAMAYVLLCNPFFMGVYWQPFTPAAAWWKRLTFDGYVPIADGYIPIALWLLWLAYVGESALTIAMPILSVRLWLQKWREKKQAAQQADA